MCGCQKNKHFGLNGFSSLPNSVSIINPKDFIEVGGVLVHPNDPRAKSGPAPTTPSPELTTRVLTAEESAEVNRIGVEAIAQQNNPNFNVFRMEPKPFGLSDDMKTYGIAALVFGTIVYFGKKFKKSKSRPKPVTL